MTHKLLNVQGIWKRLCSRPEKALHYAMADLAVDLLGVRQPPKLRSGEFWALRDISLAINPGEVVGVIGQNGAGKSTLIKIISGIINPTHGRVTLGSQNIALIDADGGLNPIQTGRENAVAQLVMHGHSLDQISEELVRIHEFADIGDFFDAPVGSYSLGMRLRLAFAIYSRLKPDLFIIDEALGGGDEQFRNRFRSYLRNYVDSGGAMLLCSHEMFAVQSFCERCIVLERGSIVMQGPTIDAIAKHHQLCRQRDSKSLSKARDNSSRIKQQSNEQPCSIKSLLIRNLGADHVVRPGDSIVIELEVAVTHDIENVACGIEIGFAEHVALATIAGGYPDGSFSLRAPTTKIQCKIENFPLAPGYYDIRAALTIPAAALYLAQIGYDDAPVGLVVSTSVSAITNLVRDRGNLVCMPADWSLHQDQSAQ